MGNCNEHYFDPDRFDDEHLELYDSVQRRMIGRVGKTFSSACLSRAADKLGELGEPGIDMRLPARGVAGRRYMIEVGKAVVEIDEAGSGQAALGRHMIETPAHQR